VAVVEAEEPLQTLLTHQQQELAVAVVEQKLDVVDLVVQVVEEMGSMVQVVLQDVEP
tara:strand:+ start:740 stop:910 length:171 start_codon:yes stop_codon:yes gene_type:complete